MEDYDSLMKQLLITIFEQIPDNSVLAIDMQTVDFEGSDSYRIIEKYRIQDDFVADCCFPDYYFLVTEGNRTCFIEAVKQYLESYLCHYKIYRKCNLQNEIWVSVFDSCLFSVVPEIKIAGELKEMCSLEGIYIDIVDRGSLM